MDKNSLPKNILEKEHVDAAVQPKLKKKSSNKNKKQINKNETTTTNSTNGKLDDVTAQTLLTTNGLGLANILEEKLQINQEDGKLQKNQLNGQPMAQLDNSKSTSSTSKAHAILNGHHHQQNNNSNNCDVADDVTIAKADKMNGIQCNDADADIKINESKSNNNKHNKNKGTKYCHIKQTTNVEEQLCVDELKHQKQQEQQPQQERSKTKSDNSLENGFSYERLALQSAAVASWGLPVPENNKAIELIDLINKGAALVKQRTTSVADNTTAAIECAAASSGNSATETTTTTTTTTASTTTTTPTISNTANPITDADADSAPTSDTKQADTETASAVEAITNLDLANVHIEYKEYESELQMHDIMNLIQAELSEPYSIYTYRYFIYNWPKLCFLAAHGNEYVGAIVCKLDMHMNVRRGYIAMLAVRKEYRKLKIGTTLVQKAIEAMLADQADEVVLETEMSNYPALRLYENLGFVRDKRLFRYYLNGVDALRLKLWFR